MFKKLRNHFLVLNMTIITIFMISTFGVIYFIMYENIQNMNKEKLLSAVNMSSISEQSLALNNVDAEIASQDVEEGLTTKVITVESGADYSLSFSIVMDKESYILAFFSYLDIPSDTYETILTKSIEQGKEEGMIEYEGKTWMYRRDVMYAAMLAEDAQQDISQEYFLDDQEIHTIEYEEPTHQKYTFLDVTESNETLSDLVISLVILGIVMLSIIFMISYYFARRSLKPIERSWDMQNQFIENASHELKTPMAIIRANTDALLSNRKDTIEHQTKWIDYIRYETDRMNWLVHDLLYLLRSQEEIYQLQKQSFDVSKTLLKAIASMEASAFERGICMDYKIDMVTTIESDEERVAQVIHILLDNAIKYAATKSTILISLGVVNRRCSLKITNQVANAESIDTDKLFDRFYRVDPARKHDGGGYGLGLSIAKAVVEKLGGKIDAKVEGDTITFSVKF